MIMTHPGLPVEWVMIAAIFMLLLTIRVLYQPAQSTLTLTNIGLMQLPVVSNVIRFLTRSLWPLILLKLIMVLIFLLIITAGLFGTPIPERNIATVLTWNIWWAGLIVSVFFLGSAWCAICPWDSLSSWLVHPRLPGGRRFKTNNSLGLKVPRWLRSVWPALIMLIALTWLELGLGITTSPYLTAVLALVMVVMAITSMAIFERKAFCRYFCPVGRTVGFYSQLAPVELRPIDTDICANCTSLDCYHGTETVDPCPTHLVMGRLQQNTYCTSCGNCSQSCPDNNVAWRLRPPSQEAIHSARPHWDEAWFMLGLLALTGFHGITMMPFFEDGLSEVAHWINDSGQLLWSFTLLMCVSLLLPVVIYMLVIRITHHLGKQKTNYKKLFSGFAFATLPLAFTYHLAHNLNHLIRENGDVFGLISNPLGIGAAPLSMMEKHMRHTEMMIPQMLLDGLQAGLIVFGFWISLRVIQHRGSRLITNSANHLSWKLLPMIVFAVLMTMFHLWLLMQPMVMRM